MTREQCPEDRRVSYASLTDAGLARIEAALPAHLEHLDEYFVGVLTPRSSSSSPRRCARCATT